MSLEKLLRDRKIEEIKADRTLIKKTFKLALRDLKTAKSNLENEDFDWALAIAYNSMLQAGRALMYSKGYRPAGPYKHVGVIEFVRKAFRKEFFDKMIYIFNKLRKKRHRVVYEEVDITTKREVESALRIAEEFVSKVKEILRL